jgi:hypothetical protein
MSIWMRVLAERGMRGNVFLPGGMFAMRFMRVARLRVLLSGHVNVPANANAYANPNAAAGLVCGKIHGCQ